MIIIYVHVIVNFAQYIQCYYKVKQLNVVQVLVHASTFASTFATLKIENQYSIVLLKILVTTRNMSYCLSICIDLLKIIFSTEQPSAIVNFAQHIQCYYMMHITCTLLQN